MRFDKPIADEVFVNNQQEEWKVEKGERRVEVPAIEVPSDKLVADELSTNPGQGMRQFEDDCRRDDDVRTESTAVPPVMQTEIKAAIWSGLRGLAAQMVVLTDEDEKLEDLLYSRLLDKQGCLSLMVLSARLLEVGKRFEVGGRRVESAAIQSLRSMIPEVG